MTDALICDCCERAVAHLRGSMWHGEAKICSACFMVWYDRGMVEPARIKAEVLRSEAAGTFPFPHADAVPRVAHLPPKPMGGSGAM